MDKKVLDIITKGYSIYFTSSTTFLPFSSLFRHLSYKETNHLLKLGSIEPVPTQHRGKGFYSKYFLIQKKMAVGDSFYISGHSAYS